MSKKILFILLLISSVNYAQLSNKHWIPPLHARGGETYVSEHYLYISTPEATPFEVSVTDGSGTPISGSPFTISQGNPQSIFIGNNQPSVMMLSQLDLNIAKTNKGLILEGSGEFYASFRLRAQNHAEILVSKGRNGAGTAFRLGSLPMTGSGGIRNFVSSFMATEDNTIVTLSEYDTGVVFASGSGDISDDIQIFNLNAGESVTVSGYTDFGPNLSGFVGALLTSTKPIVVNTGNATGGMLDENSGQDFNLDQIVPVDIVGDEYIIVKGNGSSNTERPLVIATQDNTQVFINGSTSSATTLNAGDYFLVPSSFYSGTVNQNMYISSDKDIYLYQIIAGATSDATSGLNFIPPLSCFWQKSVDMIPSFNSIGSATFPNSEIIVVTETGSTVSINNVPTTATPQSVTGNLNWVTYRISGLSGNVKIESTGPLAAGVFGAVSVAGFGGYYSGFGSLPRDTEITLCSNETINLYDAITGNPEPNGTWTIPTGAPPLNGNDFIGTINTPGDYIYTFSKVCDNSNLRIPVTVTVNVEQAPFVGTDNVLTICANESPVDLFTLLGTGVTTGGTWSPALASGTGVFNPALDNGGTYTYTISAGVICSSVSSSIVVTKNPVPVVTNQTVTVCSDVALNFNLDNLITGTGDTFTYSVVSSDNTNVPAGSPRTVASANNITDTYTNTTNAPVTITYTITPISANGCNGSTFNLAVTVNPEPVISNQTAVTCSDVALNYSLDALLTSSGDTFTYSVVSSDNVNVPSVSPRTVASGANITDVYTNTTTAPVTITYIITPISSNGCIGSTFSLAVTVNPEPVVTNQVAATCSTVALNYSLDSLITGMGDTFTYSVVSSDNTNVPAGSPRTTASATNITDLYTNTTNAAVILTYTITPINANGCAGNTFTLAVSVHPNPIILPISNFELCDDATDGDDTNGSVNFNLTLKTTEILGTQTGITVTYHTDSNEATLGQNAITNIITTNRVIYVRLTNNVTGCFSTTSFNLVVKPLPVIDSSVELKQCDTDSDAITDFNLTQAAILISTDITNTYSYHNSLFGAENNTDFVTNEIVHTAANGDKVWARITNTLGCTRTAEVNLVVSATTIPRTYSYTIPACDDYLSASDPDDDGIDYFNLTLIEPLLTVQFPSGQSYTYSYYLNEADATAEQNAIVNITNFRNTIADSQPIWVRIESNLYECAGLGPYLRLVVNPLPDFDLGEDLILCIDPVTGVGSQTINATPSTPGSYSYQWTPINSLGNSGLYNVTAAGTYAVVVTNTSAGCQFSDTINVTTSSAPASLSVVLTTPAFSSGLATIEAIATSGFGIYEYSLNAIDWQSSPIFSGLENGNYTIYVRDIQGCDLLVSDQIQTITYPNYFTPNGDGYNDTWVIRLPSEYNGLITIYDRYGKLIKQISSYGAGWDGTFNGIALPSTDYWFKVEYTENNQRKEFKSHFSLKR
jgi:gliding motility-associated-like protein